VVLDSLKRDAITLRMLEVGESVKADPGAGAAAPLAGALDAGGRVFG